MEHYKWLGDAYKLLNVTKDAPAAVIKAAWKAKMNDLNAHPDKGGSQETAQKLNRAKEILTGPEKSIYDQWLRQQGSDAKSSNQKQKQQQSSQTRNTESRKHNAKKQKKEKPKKSKTYQQADSKNSDPKSQRDQSNYSSRKPNKSTITINGIRIETNGESIHIDGVNINHSNTTTFHRVKQKYLADSLYIKCMQGDLQLKLVRGIYTYLDADVYNTPCVSKGHLEFKLASGIVYLPIEKLELRLEIKSNQGSISGYVVHEGFIKNNQGNINLNVADFLQIKSKTNFGNESIVGTTHNAHKALEIKNNMGNVFAKYDKISSLPVINIS